jgi:ATP-dependent helicase HrpA
VARLRLPEKIARTLTEGEIPSLDRPVRFVVLRGQRGAVRSDDLEDLKERLAQPWSPDEVADFEEDRSLLSPAEREVKEIAGEFRRHRRSGEHRAGARHGVRQSRDRNRGGGGGRPSRGSSEQSRGRRRRRGR